MSNEKEINENEEKLKMLFASVLQELKTRDDFTE